MVSLHTIHCLTLMLTLTLTLREAAHKILNAASAHGFLFIKNDGKTIPPTDIQSMFDLSQSFFHLPLPQKHAFAIHSHAAGGVNRGWVCMSGEALDPQASQHGDPKEAFNIGPPNPTLQPLPSPLSESAHLISRFQNSCHTLCTTILSLLNTALEIPDRHYFSARHDQSKGPSGSIFRMLYYPQTQVESGEEESIRAGAHSDYGSITLLFRLPGQAGLELQTSNGWIPVPVDPEDGDLLCYWTNGLLKSTVHRVTSSRGSERYSMAYFCHPLDDVKLATVPSPIISAFGDQGANELKSQRRRLGLSDEADGVITAKEHLERRLKVTYGL
ncbi:hypothetical protein GQ44DRAFT_749284 [Phaeosphaeriaceae sp. PMI808]|nr:hypothetical protein GQ44DRAFT_749284 [Phaeosphaeriaceae sp. PMI808]